MIHCSMDRLEAFWGRRPLGWLGPGLTQTYDTPELLAETGVSYIGGWVCDDDPTVITTAKGPLVTLPYTVELNDISMMTVQHHERAYWKTRVMDQFKRLCVESAERPKTIAIAVHAYISGQPHSIRYLEEVNAAVAEYAGVASPSGSTRRARSGRRSSPSPCMPTSPASRIAFATWRK